MYHLTRFSVGRAVQDREWLIDQLPDRLLEDIRRFYQSTQSRDQPIYPMRRFLAVLDSLRFSIGVSDASALTYFLRVRTGLLRRDLREWFRSNPRPNPKELAQQLRSELRRSYQLLDPIWDLVRRADDAFHGFLALQQDPELARLREERRTMRVMDRLAGINARYDLECRALEDLYALESFLEKRIGPPEDVRLEQICDDPDRFWQNVVGFPLLAEFRMDAPLEILRSVDVGFYLLKQLVWYKLTRQTDHLLFLNDYGYLAGTNLREAIIRARGTSPDWDLLNRTLEWKVLLPLSTETHVVPPIITQIEEVHHVDHPVE